MVYISEIYYSKISCLLATSWPDEGANSLHESETLGSGPGKATRHALQQITGGAQEEFCSGSGGGRQGGGGGRVGHQR